MTDDKNETIPKGSEWEVLAMADSTYAVGPGSAKSFVDDGQRNLNGTGDSEASSQAMFMSGHFVFPPKLNEDSLPKSEFDEESGVNGSIFDVPEGVVHREDKLNSKHEDCSNICGRVPSTSKQDEKDDGILLHGINFSNDASINLLEKEREQSMYSSETFESVRSRASACSSYNHDDGAGIIEPSESLGDAIKSSPSSSVEEHAEEEDKYGYGLPIHSSEAWWRRHAASICDRAKNANPFWSIFAVSSVMGLVFLSHRWHRGGQQVLRLKSQFIIDDEGTGWILGPVYRLKAVNLSGQHGSYIRFVSQ